MCVFKAYKRDRVSELLSARSVWALAGLGAAPYCTVLVHGCCPSRDGCTTFAAAFASPVLDTG